MSFLLKQVEQKFAKFCKYICTVCTHTKCKIQPMWKFILPWIDLYLQYIVVLKYAYRLRFSENCKSALQDITQEPTSFPYLVIGIIIGVIDIFAVSIIVIIQLAFFAPGSFATSSTWRNRRENELFNTPDSKTVHHSTNFKVSLKRINTHDQ